MLDKASDNPYKEKRLLAGQDRTSSKTRNTWGLAAKSAGRSGFPALFGRCNGLPEKGFFLERLCHLSLVESILLAANPPSFGTFF
jgi:hypothetical protein